MRFLFRISTIRDSGFAFAHLLAVMVATKSHPGGQLHGRKCSGRNDNEAATGATTEAFAKWLQNRRRCVELPSAEGVSFRHLILVISPGARGSYPAPRVKVFFFADSGSPEARLQFPCG